MTTRKAVLHRKKDDRRVRRTLQSLRDALLALMVEKGYGAVTVQDILDRANVGRSTFYSHFRDKEELLAHGLELLRAELAEVQQKARATGGSEPAFAFTLALFEHVHSHRALYKAVAGHQSGVLVLREFQRMFARLVRHELMPFAPRDSEAKYLLDLTIASLAASLLAVIAEWLDRYPRISPAEVNRIFQQLTVPGVVAILGHDVSPR
jgi:AcrR family transcriptional regulator